MGMKEMCFDWVEERKTTDEDGNFWIQDPNTGEILEGPYTEEEIDDILWNRSSEGVGEGLAALGDALRDQAKYAELGL